MTPVRGRSTMSRMTKAEAVRRAGSQQALADVLGISRQAVCAWGENVPKMRVYQLKVVRPAWFRKGAK